MLKKIFIAAILLTPIVTFAQSNTALDHADSYAFFIGGKSVHAPEIDGGNAVLGIALLGGIISLMVRKNKKNKKDD